MHPIHFFYRACRRYGNNTAVQTPTETVTYAQLCERVNAVAAALQELDPHAQSRVGICSGNTLEHIIALLAVLAAGKVWVALNYRDSITQLNRILDFTQPTIVMASAQYGSTLNLRNIEHPIALDQEFSGVGATLAQLLDKHAGRKPERTVNTPETLQAIKFTGGSTGVPKGVMQPGRAWCATILNLIDAHQFGESDRNLIITPLTHGAGTYLLPVLAKGGCHVILDDTSPAGVLDALQNLAISNVFMPPTLIYMVMAAGANQAPRFPALKHLVCGGAPMPAEKLRNAQEFFGPVIAMTYGQTEAPQIISFAGGADLVDTQNINSVGRASLLSDFAIMDAEGRLLPDGQTGEVVVRGDMLMSGYLGMPEKTAETIVDGWLHTGDLGYVDARGYLYLRGRSRELIITGGFNVYPVDVEDELSKHPMVHEAAVFGVDDEKWGEAVHAAIQLKAGAQLTEDELILYVKDRMGSVKAPKFVHFYENLPRSAVGKVDKVVLKQRHSQPADAPR